jgi:hypothetical protein
MSFGPHVLPSSASNAVRTPNHSRAAASIVSRSVGLLDDVGLDGEHSKGLALLANQCNLSGHGIS